MSVPTPFEVSRQIGQNLGGMQRKMRESSTIDEVLEQASATDDPQVMNDLIGKIIQNVSPQNQKAAVGILQNRINDIKDKRTQQSHENIANSLEEAFPESELHQAMAGIYRSKLPSDEKERIVKNIVSAVPFKFSQQQRLMHDSVLKRYNSRIKEIDEELKTANRARRQELQTLKSKLQAERDALLDFDALKPEETVEEEKIKFDPNNPEHMQIFEEVEKKYKGDRQKINAELAERFTL